MSRSYYSRSVGNFLEDQPAAILGALAQSHPFSLDEAQKHAWLKQIEILQKELCKFLHGHIFFEFRIPRMGKRIDNVFIFQGIIFVIEFKVGGTEYPKYAIDQVVDYATDLKYFHAESFNRTIVPMLICTDAAVGHNDFEKYDDEVYRPLRGNSKQISSLIQAVCGDNSVSTIDPLLWEDSRYKPTPTIIEAAQVLYRGHSVSEITRSDSGAENLNRTAEDLNQIIDQTKRNKTKSICFITGVPGAGKTLAGLNIANERHRFQEDEHAVFLSGNGPLVEVLQEALARNDVENRNSKKKDALREAKAFIQNIHHFRDDALDNQSPPLEKVAIFDEAQRAWTLEQTSSFMKEKKGRPDFCMSEPEFLISVMDRHRDWAVIVCLIGGGQEINTGEAGLPEWFSALQKAYSHWDVYYSNRIADAEYTRGESMTTMTNGLNCQIIDSLHLAISIRVSAGDKM